MFGILALLAGGFLVYKLTEKDSATAQKAPNGSAIPTFGMDPNSDAFKQFAWLIQNGSAAQMESAAKWWDGQPGGAQVAQYIRQMAAFKFGNASWPGTSK